MDTLIYALADPEQPESYRYVGKTTCAIGRRLRSHMCDQSSTPRARWCRKLLREGRAPFGVILEIVPDGEDWSAREQHWIITLRAHGYNLLNLANGGEGATRDSNRQRWLHMSEEEKQIAITRFERCRDEARAAGVPMGMGGKKHTPETRAKMSASRRGNTNARGKTWTLSEQTRQRMREAQARRKFLSGELRRI